MSKASPRATITDVARAAGVAISSASAALNDRPGVSTETRVRVRAVADQLGYVPALAGRSLASKRAFSVGFVVERDYDIIQSDPFFGGFIGGIEESLTPRGYALALQISQDEAGSEARLVELIESRRVDGLFLDEIRINDSRLAALSARNAPVVAANAPRGEFPFPSVRQDGTAAIRSLVEELVKLGHRRIAHVTGPDAYEHSIERRDAWASAMLSHGLEPDVVIPGDFTYEGGEHAADLLVEDDRGATAVFCANDLSAIGVMNRLHRRGVRVPEDISIVGYDDISLGRYVRPTLSTVQTSPRLLGTVAAEMLLAAIEGAKVQDIEVAPAAFVRRESISTRPADVKH
ncbi:DNA-binding LacI/PurR family transcriptional regulator [Microbacterium proteolyticum]|uniref:DNA-binding LacI/PurR family transcriptional regulator n=1 Tax=Microbacterium proteolyticum TaxID=1572644 RepID=A0A7W5CJF7_9MICO|nr:LacI family DNA-binding transcriptional regulator [Microbacterium proteolyticum]MBB3158340.1 DNA-binding LacI/PurR family transcriptional regulator [Microbacterium proteolyticum]